LISILTKKQRKNKHRKRKKPPNKSPIREIKKFLERRLRKNSVPHDIQQKQRTKKARLSNCLHGDLPINNTVDRRITSKLNIKSNE